MWYTVIIVSVIILFWIIGYVSFKGLDLREKISWMFGAVAFLCGFAIILSFNIDNINDFGGLSASEQLTSALLAGVSFLAITMFTGAVTRYHQISSKNRDEGIKSIYSQLNKKKDKNFFARLAQEILKKFI